MSRSFKNISTYFLQSDLVWVHHISIFIISMSQYQQESLASCCTRLWKFVASSKRELPLQIHLFSWWLINADSLDSAHLCQGQACVILGAELGVRGVGTVSSESKEGLATAAAATYLHFLSAGLWLQWKHDGQASQNNPLHINWYNWAVQSYIVRWSITLLCKCMAVHWAFSTIALETEQSSQVVPFVFCGFTHCVVNKY